MARIALARTDVDIHDPVFDIVDPILTETPDEDAMEIDGKDSSRKSEETYVHASLSTWDTRGMGAELTSS